MMASTCLQTRFANFACIHAIHIVVMITNIHISLEIFAIDMFTAYKAVRVLINLKADPKQK